SSGRRQYKSPSLAEKTRRPEPQPRSGYSIRQNRCSQLKEGRKPTMTATATLAPPQTLRVEHIQKSYGGRRVVDDVSFHVASGEIVGLLGRNDPGKTTSFDMVLGLVKPEEGRIRLENIELTRMAIHLRSRRGISYLPQEASVFRKLSVYDN